MKALLVSRPGRMKKRRSEQRRVIMYRRPGTMARGSDMPRLSATAVRKLLTAGKYLYQSHWKIRTPACNIVVICSGSHEKKVNPG